MTQENTPSWAEQQIELLKARLDEAMQDIARLDRLTPTRRNLEVIDPAPRGKGGTLFAKYTGNDLVANGCYEGVLFTHGSGNDLIIEDWADTDLGSSGNDIITILNWHEIHSDAHAMTSSDFGTPADIPYPVYRTNIRYPDDDTPVYVGWHVRVGGTCPEGE